MYVPGYSVQCGTGIIQVVLQVSYHTENIREILIEIEIEMNIFLVQASRARYHNMIYMYYYDTVYDT